MNDVPILNEVISTFDVKEAVVFYLLFIPQSKQVLVLHDLRPNKSFFKIGMDNTGSFRGGGTFCTVHARTSFGPAVKNVSR